MSALNRHSLPPGTIYRVAELAKLELRYLSPEKSDLRCPFHDDRHASAVVFITNVFLCPACGLRLRAREFAERLNIPWNRRDRSNPFRSSTYAKPIATSTVKEEAFRPQDAESTWTLALDHSRDISRSRQVLEYLRGRGLERALELASCAALDLDPRLPPTVARWPSSGYSLIAPLLNKSGQINAIQSRLIVNGDPKTKFPRGSRVSGSVFANALGLALLRGDPLDEDFVVYGEGLTDSIAFSLASPFPALCSPGTSMYVAGLGSWVRGRTILLCSDADAAGDRVIPDATRAAFRFGARRVVRMRWSPPAKDACDVVAAFGLERLRATLVASMGAPR